MYFSSILAIFILILAGIAIRSIQKQQRLLKEYFKLEDYYNRVFRVAHYDIDMRTDKQKIEIIRRIHQEKINDEVNK